MSEEENRTLQEIDFLQSDKNGVAFRMDIGVFGSCIFFAGGRQYPNRLHSWRVYVLDTKGNMGMRIRAADAPLLSPKGLPKLIEIHGKLYALDLCPQLVYCDSSPYQCFEELSALLFASLKMLRTTLVRESDDRVMAYHIFVNKTLQEMSRKIPRTEEELSKISGINQAKVTKYGDRILATIESTIMDYYKTHKNSSSSNDSNEGKRKRDGNKDQTGRVEDDDFTKSTDRSKKRSSKTQSQTIEEYSYLQPDVNQIIDEDLDLYGYDFEVNA